MNYDYNTFKIIDAKCTQWVNETGEKKAVLEMQKKLNDTKVTIIVTRWQQINTPTGPKFAYNKINVYPNDPRIQQLFKTYLIQPNLLDWNPKLYIFPQMVNATSPYTQFELHFHSNEAEMRKTIWNHIPLEKSNSEGHHLALEDQECVII